jgi:putative ABC transport system permease protein
MRWVRGLKISAEMLWAHKLRTVLSLLGIAIGIATVSVMAAVGQGSERKVLESIRGMGTNLISITAGKVRAVAGRSRRAALVTSLVRKDARTVRERAADLVSLVAPAQSKKLTVKFENIAISTNIVGATAEFLPVRNLRLASGEIFDDLDDRAARRVAVLGQTLVRDMFGGADAIGHTIRVGKVPFRIIGTLAAAGVDMNGVDQDDQILIPLRTALRRVFNLAHLNNIYVQVRSETQIEECALLLREILRDSHRLRSDKADDFTIQNQTELLSAHRETQGAFTALTVGVASLSLAVGGIGILAVMLMSVRERVKEIGLRRALGARRVDILFQFLVEAAILSFAGGVAGIMLGVVATFAVAGLAGWEAVLVPKVLLLVAVLSGAIGLLFGTVPARKAARTNPVVSLRAE